jgi:hypothetical protein
MLQFLTRREYGTLQLPKPTFFTPGSTVLDLEGVSEHTLQIIIELLITTVHNITRIHHVEVDGRKYFGHPTTRYDPPADAVYLDDDVYEDPDEVYFFGGIGRRTVDFGNLTYHLEYDEEEYSSDYQADVLDELEGDYGSESYIATTAKALMSFKDFPNMQVRLGTPLRFLNESGFNTDIRGSDSTSIILDYNRVWKIDPDENGMFSFSAIAEACYRVKSHKFDAWYELYSSAKLVKEWNSVITVNLTYDHGS